MNNINEEWIDSSKNGIQFSFLIRSMRPSEDIKIDDKKFDEFGFRLDDQDEFKFKEQSDDKLKLKWISYLEFNTNKNMKFKSLNEIRKIEKTEKLRELLIDKGIPHSMRGFIWMRLSGALDKKLNSTYSYSNLLEKCQKIELNAYKQIEKDLLRTFPSNYCFMSQQSIGIPRLRRILQSIAWLYPSIGYCQGMGSICASLLLFIEEEDAFWMMCSIIESLLPSSFYSHTLTGLQVDMKVLRELISIYLPQVERKLVEFDIEISLIMVNWFLTLFSNVVNMKCLIRIWDLFFIDGSLVLFQITLALLQMNEKSLVSEDISTNIDLFNILNEIPLKLTLDLIPQLFDTMKCLTSSVSKTLVDRKRAKYYKEMKNLNRNFTLNTDHLSKRYFEGTHVDLKLKNVVQTELLIRLNEVIVKFLTHFQEYDPENYQSQNLSTNPDYSVQSHTLDYLKLQSSESRKTKKAKALVSFKATDSDELSFNKNDVINVISFKDEHCWIGELDGYHGWFPAKYVHLIDSHNYSPAGDDATNAQIKSLVRVELCSLLKTLFDHGLIAKTNRKLHPWLFVESVANRITRNTSAQSRLNLCRSFQLDDLYSILAPEELLSKNVDLINKTHLSDDYDAKFQTLVCQALNEQLLHIWLEILCSNVDMCERYYEKWSFMRSPGWIHIKCELRLLAQFSFSLDTQAQSTSHSNNEVFPDSLQDTLMKHHLFSWDIN